jgi:hypothetical protein
LWLLVLTPAAAFGVWRILAWAAEVHTASSERWTSRCCRERSNWAFRRRSWRWS